jgi:hypothetical protein
MSHEHMLTRALVMLALPESVGMPHVATLALGSRARQKGCKGAGQKEARESHQRLPGV